MNASRQQLHALVDMVEESGINTLYDVMMRFIPEDEALPDEIEAIRLADEEFARGEFVRHEDIDWS